MQFKSNDEIKNFLNPIAEPMGIEIVDVEYSSRENALTVFVDTADGIDLNTCEKFHNAIMEPIDILDPSFGAPYTLNVSSPGLDRPFKTKRDFERNLGKDIEIKLFAPYKGKKFLEGTMTAYNENTVTIKTEKEEIKLQKNKIAKINKAIKFDD